MIRIAIVDDHPAMRAGLATVLEAAPDLVAVGSAGTAEDVRPLINTTAPDVVLLDYHLPGRDGLQLCRQIKSQPLAPGVLLYTAYAGAELAIPALLAGADGIIGKDVPALALYEAIRAAATGETVLPPVPAELRAQATQRLDPDDVPILGMLLEGTSPADAAAVLDIPTAALSGRVDRMIQRLRLDMPLA